MMDKKDPMFPSGKETGCGHDLHDSVKEQVLCQTIEMIAVKIKLHINKQLCR